MVDEAIRSE